MRGHNVELIGARFELEPKHTADANVEEEEGDALPPPNHDRLIGTKIRPLKHRRWLLLHCKHRWSLRELYQRAQ